MNYLSLECFKYKAYIAALTFSLKSYKYYAFIKR